MYMLKATEDGKKLMNRVCRSFVVCYMDYSLEIASSIIRVDDQEAFFNVLPLLRKAREIANEELIRKLGMPKEGFAGEMVFDGLEEDATIVEPYTYLSAIEKNRPLFTDKPVSVCVAVGIEESRPNHISPFVQFLGISTYQGWSFIYGALNKLISEHGTHLSHMELNLIDHTPVTKSVDDIVDAI